MTMAEEVTEKDSLEEARSRLIESLGDNSRLYFRHMKLWFQMKTTKKEFDREIRRLIPFSQIRLHNDFVMCLLEKCHFAKPCSVLRSLRSVPRPVLRPIPEDTGHMSDRDKRARLKRKNRCDKGNFEPADSSEFVNPIILPPSQGVDDLLRYSSQELFLPDASLVYGRMLLGAWEAGLKGAEERTAEIVVIAVQLFLKNVLNAILSRKKAFKMKNGKFQHAMGCTVPDPWLRNSANAISKKAESRETKVRTREKVPKEETKPEASKQEVTKKDKKPKGKVSMDDPEQKAAYELACGSQSKLPSQPITPYDLFEALQVYRNAIPSHTIYAVNMERIISKMRHPSWEELEAMEADT